MKRRNGQLLLVMTKVMLMISSNLQERRNGHEKCGRYKCFDFRRVLWRVSQVKLCRGANDDKFLECAKDFCEEYLND